MQWYEIVIGVLSVFGGGAGLISIYKARPEKTSIEVKNMKEMLDEAHKMFEKAKEEKEEEHREFEEYKATNMKYIAEFKARFAKVEERLDKAEETVFHLKGAIYRGYRCKYPEKPEDCPVIREYEKLQCDGCVSCEDK